MDYENINICVIFENLCTVFKVAKLTLIAFSLNLVTFLIIEQIHKIHSFMSKKVL